MAFKPVAWAYKNERLGGNKLLVLTCLALYANEDGGDVYPSVATISKETGLSRRTVQRVLGELQRERWIKTARPSKANKMTKNVGRCFQLNYKRLKPQGCHTDAGVTVTRVSNETPEGRHSDAQTIHKPIHSDIDSADGFSAWWQHYPKKVAKKAAQRAWSKLKPDAELQAEIMADTISRDWPKESRFVLHPATYLNGARWEDEKPVEVIENGTKTRKRGSAVDQVRDAGKDWLTEQQRQRSGFDNSKVIEGRFTRGQEPDPE
jgi:hypothetical protein